MRSPHSWKVGDPDGMEAYMDGTFTGYAMNHLGAILPSGTPTQFDYAGRTWILVD